MTIEKQWETSPMLRKMGVWAKETQHTLLGCTWLGSLLFLRTSFQLLRVISKTNNHWASPSELRIMPHILQAGRLMLVDLCIEAGAPTNNNVQPSNAIKWSSTRKCKEYLGQVKRNAVSDNPGDIMLCTWRALENASLQAAPGFSKGKIWNAVVSGRENLETPFCILL